MSSSVEGINATIISITGRAPLREIGTKTYQPIHQDTCIWLPAGAHGQLQHTRTSYAPRLPWVKARIAPLTGDTIGGTAGVRIKPIYSPIFGVGI